MYFVAAGVLVGFLMALAIALVPLIAVTPDSGSAKWWCPGSAVAVKDIYRPYLSATLLAQS
jgi:hypothetical protein